MESCSPPTDMPGDFFFIRLHFFANYQLYLNNGLPTGISLKN
jgi:hypothetical protein